MLFGFDLSPIGLLVYVVTGFIGALLDGLGTFLTDTLGGALGL